MHQCLHYQRWRTLAMSMSRRLARISLDDNIGDAFGGAGVGWIVDEKAHDMCRGEGEGG